MASSHTIAAISSSTLPAARIIVRVSGTDACHLFSRLSSEAPTTAGAGFARLALRGMSIPATVYRFRAPRSYTGEDLVEFHIPGNPLLAQLLMEELLAHGARSAEPGEFTARAFFNGRLDLAQAEGVALAIAAQSDREVFAARRLLVGELTRRLAPAADALADTLALLEAGIDFSEEDISFLERSEARRRITSMEKMLTALLSESVRCERIAREPRVVLTGRPNAGKSTLLNALAGRTRAVVSPQSGTTRDLIWADVRLPRGTVRMIDAAGLEDSDAQPEEGSIAAQMRRAALLAIEEADVVVLLIDATDARPALKLPREPHLVVRSKSDLLRAGPLSLSAITGEGIDAFRAEADRRAFGDAGDAGSGIALNARHVDAIHQGIEALRRAADLLEHPVSDELIALELREALDALGAVSGRVTSDDVLGRIFSTFCVGK
jgi:tRNA modification GTPase